MGWLGGEGSTYFAGIRVGSLDNGAPSCGVNRLVDEDEGEEDEGDMSDVAEIKDCIFGWN